MNPLVSVVIPSLGRPEVHRAVASAVGQTGVRVEVIVVVNGSAELPVIDHPHVTVIDARDRTGQGIARQLGVERATGDLIALLDDDDWWESGKLARQLRDVETLNGSIAGHWIAATGLRIHQEDGAVEHRPRRNEEPCRIEDVASWLFCRTSVTRQDHFLQSSSLLFPRSLALTSPFVGLPEIHTDWGWILTTQKLCGADVFLCSGHATHYDVSTGAGVARRHKYRASMSWAAQMLPDTDRRARADFLLTVPAGMAAAVGDTIGVVTVAREAIRCGCADLAAYVLWIRHFAMSLARRRQR